MHIDICDCLILNPKLNPKLNRIQVVLHIDFWNFVDLTATEVEGLGTSLNPKPPPPRGQGARLWSRDSGAEEAEEEGRESEGSYTTRG